MFWIAQILMVVAGLIGIALVRTVIVRRFPRVTERRLDIALILLLVAGVAIGVREYGAQMAETRALSEQIDVVRNYSDVAQLTFNGSPYVGGDIEFNSELSGLMKGTFVKVEGDRFRRLCTDEAQAKRRQAIERFPRFPFSYYWLALCLRDQDNADWRPLAKSALAIFERTTQVAGHQGSHDEAKAYLAGVYCQRPLS